MTSRARELANTAGVDGSLSNRNRIINGAMQVAQRGTSATFDNANSGYLVCDRWNFAEGGTEPFVFAITQSTDAPAGFAYSLKLDCTTAAPTPASSALASVEQKIEAQDLQQLSFGTSSAQSLTLSFWVKSSKTGTYIVWFFQDDALRSISAAYTINSANTWEQKTVTIAGDTSGQIDNDNGSGFRVRFMLFAGTDFTSGTLQTSWGSSANNADRYVGQVNLADSTANEWSITGVQLEAGDVATPFEHRSYGQELALCQRYYFSANLNQWLHRPTDSDPNLKGTTRFAQTMRVTPTITNTATAAVTAEVVTPDYVLWARNGQAGVVNVQFYTASAEL